LSLRGLDASISNRYCAMRTASVRILTKWDSAMYRFSRLSTAFAALAIFALTTFAVRSANAAECPNKFGKKTEVSGGDATKEKALKELEKALDKALADEAKECKEKTCTDEPKAKCRFVHTVTKPDCKAGPGAPAPAFICNQFYRPGCFCLTDDEEIELKAVKNPGKAKQE
jgi:hypothetical protein